MAKTAKVMDIRQAIPASAKTKAAQFASATKPRKGVCNSKLQPWADQIEYLIGKGYTLEQVRQFLADNQVEITINGICNYRTRKREKELRVERAAQALAVRSPSDYPRPTMTTLNSKLSDAEICRRNGWGVGTLLAGDEGHGVTVIRITAVGDDCVLAREVCHAGKPASDIAGRELNWSLTCRDWRVVAEPVPTPSGA